MSETAGRTTVKRRNRRGKGGRGGGNNNKAVTVSNGKEEPSLVGPYKVSGGQLQAEGPAKATKKKRNRKKKTATSDPPVQVKQQDAAAIKTKGKTENSSTDPASLTATLNSQLRMHVEQNDASSLRKILYDTKNQKLEIDTLVLESVLKTYVMSAMFQEATHCLQHCTLAGALLVSQTERVLLRLPQKHLRGSLNNASEMISCLCAATTFDSPAIRDYFLRIVKGIALEFLELATAARVRICNLPCDILSRDGLCVGNSKLEVHKRGGKKSKISELAVIPFDGLVKFSDETKGIHAGDVVAILPYEGPESLLVKSLDGMMVEAVVTNSNPIVLRLSERKGGAEAIARLTMEGNLFRIDKLANRTSYQRQLAAAAVMASPVTDAPSLDLDCSSSPKKEKTRKDPRRPCPQLLRAIASTDTSTQQDGQTSTAKLCRQAVPWDKWDEPDAEIGQKSIQETAAMWIKSNSTLIGLKQLQARAVEEGVTNRLTLVQGDTSSGKSTVAVRIIEHWAKVAANTAVEHEEGVTPWPILVASESNVAIDVIMEGCAAIGLQVARLGRPDAVSDGLLPSCIDQPSSRSETSAPPFKERVRRLKRAQVIFCTCVDSARDILDALGPLERVIVAEATQVTESAILVPLVRGCRQLVLLGDLAQREPLTLTPKAANEGHGVPLFSRLVDCGVRPCLLEHVEPSNEQTEAEKRAFEEAKKAIIGNLAKEKGLVRLGAEEVAAIEDGKAKREILVCDDSTDYEKPTWLQDTSKRDAADPVSTQPEKAGLDVELKVDTEDTENVQPAFFDTKRTVFPAKDPDCKAGPQKDNTTRGIPSLEEPAIEEASSKQKDCQDCQCVVS